MQASFELSKVVYADQGLYITTMERQVKMLLNLAVFVVMLMIGLSVVRNMICGIFSECTKERSANVQHPALAWMISDWSLGKSREEVQKVKENNVSKRVTMEHPVSKKGGYKYNITIVTHSPGIGNQLFELASLIGIARKNEMNLIVPKGISVLTKHFNLEETRKHPILGEHNTTLDDFGKFESFSKRSNREYDNRTESLHELNCNLKLDGYYHSFKYFEFMEDSIRKEFTFKKEVQDKVDAFIAKNVPKEGSYTKIGIHIRRGDFLREDAQAFGDGVATPEYIAHAIKYFEDKFKNIWFIVAGNGQDWAKENVHAKHVTFSENLSAMEDMALLSKCDHMIATSGTFSWWAAWFANGISVYYKGYPIPGTPLWKTYKKEDYFQKDAILMD